ncbi:MAG TPA: DNA polymerase I [Candidatus Paceibacterota bacterium]|nr:DNA polymerase I [Candidatus Paceibacterota bacterium]
MRKLILIDSNALVHRAFHALPPLTAPDGRMTNAVYGFTSVLLKMLNDLKPDFIAATFDMAGPTFRHEEYEEYKATRVKAPDELYAQIPLVKDILTAMGIPIFEHAGFEADDVIGTIAQQTQELPDLQTIIVTGDLDTLQLVHGKKVVVFTLRKGMTDTVTYDESGVHERYGMSPGQVPDFKGLKGDPSDNIPGVKGIGEKTAVSLIQEFGSVEALYTALERPSFAQEAAPKVTAKLRTKLLDQKDSALFSKKLATIIRDVPLAFTLETADWRKNLDLAKLESLCRDLGFYSLAKRIPTVLHKVVAETTGQVLDLDGTAQPLSSGSVQTLGPDEFPTGDVAAVAAELDDEAVRHLYLTADGQEVYELKDPTPERVVLTLAKYRTVIAHDLKPLLRLLPDTRALMSHVVEDSDIAAWLVAPDQREYGLDRVYYEFAAQALDASPAAWPVAIWRLHPILQEKLRSLKLLPVYADIEMPLVPVLADMEKRGIRVDTRTIDDLLTIASREVTDLEQKIWKLAGTEFNINSPSQLADILFNRLAIRGRVRRTSGGAPSTAAPELEKLREEHPIIDLILQYREMSKLKTTYIEPFPSLVRADGRVHTTYNQTGTATGRLSSSDPNLQNIPTRTELGQRFRAAFVADPGWKLLSLDYSQLELRLVAHMAQDRTMIEAFRNGEDIHTRTASEVFGLAPAQVTKDMRRQAKVLNFGIIYGMGVLGFARAAGVTRDAAKRFIDEYFARFAGVSRYIERTKHEAYERGFVETLLGRRRPLPDIASRIPQLAAAAERMAVNHPIQGTGADLVKLAMIAVDRHLRDTGQDARVRMLLQVHDELVLEVRADILDEVTAEIRSIMESVHALDVPLIVDAKSGENWAEMTPVPR